MMAKTITKEELKRKIDQNDNFKLIEVLSPEDYQKEHITGAINIPVSNIESEAQKKFNKDDEIVVYCASSSCQASPTAAKKLDGLGFSNVYDFEGGKKEWKEADFPMESNDKGKSGGCCCC